MKEMFVDVPAGLVKSCEHRVVGEGGFTLLCGV